jgi:O-antigen ligase
VIATQDTVSQALRGFAAVAATIMLLVAPFPASAGLRGAMLLLAALALLVAALRTGGFRTAMRPSAALMVVAAMWVVYVAIMAASSPDPRTSLESWRGDVLVPVVACAVFYALSHRPRNVWWFTSVLLVGVVVLTVMMIRDPYRPGDPAHDPLYGGIGRLSAWYVTFAPVVALLWLLPATWRWTARAASVIAVISLSVGAWLTENRAIWLCYAAMLVAGSLTVALTQPSAVRRWRAIAVVGALLVVIAAGFTASVNLRADAQVGVREAPMVFLAKDVRSYIWGEALTMIRERPWAGRGYDLDIVRQEFLQRMKDPRVAGWIDHPHNIVLDTALQIGVIGGVLLLMVFIALLVEFLRLAWAARASQDRHLAIAAGCGVALVTGVLLRNMVDDFFSRHMVLLFGAMAGLLLGLAQRQHNLKAD